MKAFLPLLMLAATPAFANPVASASCAQTAEQLTDYLASAKRRVDRDGEVRAEFDVGADGRPRLVSVQGTRVYRTPVRTAIDSLDCRGGTPQRYVVHIRFADAVPQTMAVAASAALAQAKPAAPTTPH